MRAFILMGILASICLFGQGQELKTKKNKDQYFTEIFQVDKKSKQKQGIYLKFQNLTKDTLVRGQYLNDSISGVWTYFDIKNRPYMKYDYSSDSCLWISEMENKPDTFPIRLRNNFRFAKLDRSPLHIGFRKELELLFASRIKIPVSLMEEGRSVIYMASFVVNKNGDIDEIQTEKIENEQIRDDVMKILKEFEGRWLPGIYNGYQVDTKLFVIFDIGPMSLGSELLKKPYIMNIGLKYFGIKTTRVVSTRSVSTPSSNAFRSNMPGSMINRGY